MPTNPTDHPVLDVIANRWSPYRFEPREIEEEKLLQCLEAARWAASSFNDQPWYWLIARRQEGEEFERMVGCLMEPNQGWAKSASALVLTVTRSSFAYNGKPNRVALHDLGQAAAHLALQAAELGLQVHQMAGIDVDAIRQQYDVPEGFDPQTAIAIGYPDQSPPQGDLAIQLHQREQGARQREALASRVFTQKWGNGADFVS